MKKMRKLLAVLMTLAMVMGLGMTSFAAEETTKPTAEDKKTATVENVEAEATVTAYQIVKADYNDFGFVGYSKVKDTLAINDVTAPTSDEVLVIAKDIANDVVTNLPSKTMSHNGTAHTAELNAGYWVVIVNGTGDNAYNPMLIGVWYSESGSDNTMTSNPVDATKNWELVTNNAFAKATKASLSKVILNLDAHENAYGNDEAFGTDVAFRVDTTIPSYSASYKEVLVKITDTLAAGLTLNTDSIKVVVGGTECDVTKSEQLDLEASVTGFTVTFNSNFALENAGKSVVVTYTATLNENAVTNSDANTNVVEYQYTRDPEVVTNVNTLTETTYTHTYEIDGEIIKVKEDKTTPLGGAVFTLTNDETGKVYTATSRDDGTLEFKGLDVGTYTLVETVAPAGYSVDNTPHTVVVTAMYGADGKIFEYGYTLDENPITNENPYSIVNTKLSALPSTGGIGTTIFTIGGCAIMIAAAYMFFVSRRRDEQ